VSRPLSLDAAETIQEFLEVMVARTNSTANSAVDKVGVDGDDDGAASNWDGMVQDLD
jgi:hypothetical protein